MEPSCSSIYHIPDKVVHDVYMLGAIIEYEIPQQSNPPLVVTEDHGGIQHVSKQLTKELPQPGIFTRDHTRSYVFRLSGAQSNCLLLPAHPGYRSRTQREPALRSCCCDPPHCLTSEHSNNHAASHFRQCISIHERLCPKDISEDSWHQFSEAQPYMSSTCQLQNIYLDRNSPRTSMLE